MLAMRRTGWLALVLMPLIFVVGVAGAAAPQPPEGASVGAPPPGRRSAILWHQVTSPTANQLNAVICPSATVCYAVGNNATIVTSTDAGATWTALSQSAVTGNLSGVACRNVTTCAVISESGGIAVTVNGGTNWTAQSPAVAATLEGVACGPNDCYAVAFGGITLKSTGGSSTWTQITSPTASNLGEIYCFDDLTCLVADLGAGIHRTTDGGASWSTRRAQDSGNIFGLTCVDKTQPATTFCLAARNIGVLMFSNNGGQSWSNGGTPPMSDFGTFGVACPASTECYTVGSGLTPQSTGATFIANSTNGGVTWTNQVTLVNTSSFFRDVACAATQAAASPPTSISSSTVGVRTIERAAS